MFADGSGPPPEALAEYVDGIDFRGKSVLDMGANLGFFAFLAARRGAACVLGMDSDPDAVEGARLLASLHGLDNVHFAWRDFLEAPPILRADMVMVIDFIGRGVVSKGRLDDVITLAARLAVRELVVTMRPKYRLEELQPLSPGLQEHYGAYLREGTFSLGEYVRDFLGDDFHGRVLHEGLVEKHQLKKAYLFTRV